MASLARANPQDLGVRRRGPAPAQQRDDRVEVVARAVEIGTRPRSARSMKNDSRRMAQVGGFAVAGQQRARLRRAVAGAVRLRQAAILETREPLGRVGPVGELGETPSLHERKRRRAPR